MNWLIVWRCWLVFWLLALVVHVTNQNTTWHSDDQLAAALIVLMAAGPWIVRWMLGKDWRRL